MVENTNVTTWKLNTMLYIMYIVCCNKYMIWLKIRMLQPGNWKINEKIR